MPGSRRTMIARDRKRSSLARKRTHRATLARDQQQAELLRQIEAKIKAQQEE